MPRNAARLLPTLSDEPVARTNSLNGLNARQLTSALCASTECDGCVYEAERVSHLPMRRQQRRRDDAAVSVRLTSAA